MPPVTLLIVGCGQRGQMYASYALERPDLAKVVAIAEPRDFIRERMRSTHEVAAECAFADWRAVVATGKRLADAVVICTQDHMHKEPAVAFAGLGYHILLEKPMAVSEEDCRAIVAAVEAAKVHFAVGHVLRYTPFMQKIISLLRSGALGDIINIQHLEPIGREHFSHSFVRGNWRREDTSTFMLMAKCCHDIDLLRYMMNKRAVSVSSMGSLVNFKKEKAPEGAASRCVDCPAAVERACPYSALKIYVEPAKAYAAACADAAAAAASAGTAAPPPLTFGWPVAVLLDGPHSVPAVEEAVASGPYGRCAWACDNDVVDNQVVSIQFEGGATATLTTVAYTELVCQRQIRIFGTRGELHAVCHPSGDKIRHVDFATGAVNVYGGSAPPDGTRLVGHGGADYFLASAFIRAVAEDNAAAILSSPRDTLDSHLLVFAAEHARLSGTVVQLKESS